MDKSAPTAMAVAALGERLARQWGPRVAAERVALADELPDCSKQAALMRKCLRGFKLPQ